MTRTFGQRVRRRSRLAACLAAGMQLSLAAPVARAQTAPSDSTSPVPVADAAPRPVRRVVAGGTIVGHVTDARNGQAISGVTVRVEGTRVGAATGDDGRYLITNVPAGAQVLVARRLGFAATRRTVTVVDDQQQTVDFVMQTSAIPLDQVVITGTAAGETRRSVGNAVSSINAGDELSKSGAPDLSSLLEARAPGLIIAPSTSRLGAGPTIQIRGRTSLSLDNTPLLYVDGVRVNNATATGPVAIAGGGSSFGGQNSRVAGRLNDISPDDIESIEVIKGPAAATIYGTEAANGVIQIITKKGGLSSRPLWTYHMEDGPLYFRDAEKRVATNYMKDSTGAIVTWNGVQSEADRGTPLFRTGQTRSYDATLSGGAGTVRYYVSSLYENDLGVEPNNTLKQFGLHTNISVAASPKLDFGSSLNFVDLSNHLGADVGVSAMLGAEVGHILLFKAARGFYPNFPPEIPQQLYDNSASVKRFTGSATIDSRPTDWFTQRAILGLDYTGDDSRALERFAPPTLAALLPSSIAGGRIGQTLRNSTIISADYSGTAKLRLTSALTASSSLGGQYYRTDLASSFLGAFGFPGPGVETVSGAANQVSSTQTETLNTTIGAYGQEQLAWHDRLYLTGALRVDNNSAFGDQFKWVSYPKVSASWIVSDEPFWHWGRMINTMKLRAAYGESGRQPNAFSALRTFSPVQGPGGTNAVTPGSFGNPNLKPERGKETEIGFEGGLFNRLSVEFTYFNKRTIDEIVNQPVAPSSGFTGNQFVNLGRVDNHGIEARASLEAITRAKVVWEITGTVATNKDVIKDLGGLPTVIASAGQFNKLGFPIGGFFSRRVVSADRDPVTKLATNVLCDGGAGRAPIACAQAPFVFIGTPTPKLSGALANTVTIANRLRLYALVDFRRGNRMLNANSEIRCLGLVGAGLCPENYYPDKYSPVVLAEAVGTAAAANTIDRFMEDASFAKLREVSASYTLPAYRWLFGGARTSLEIAARELHIWTRYTGPDPEVNVANVATSSTAQDQGLIPPLTRLIAILNVRF
jgi:TonB-linked SusC/RagA family outer membrane protein